jgi:Mor family transcriptional regulator
MGASEKVPVRPAPETDRRDRELRDATIFSMVVAGGKSPTEVAAQFQLTVGDVRRIVRKVRQRASGNG